jgi:hypothetical protein
MDDYYVGLHGVLLWHETIPQVAWRQAMFHEELLAEVEVVFLTPSFTLGTRGNCVDPSH